MSGIELVISNIRNDRYAKCQLSHLNLTWQLITCRESFPHADQMTAIFRFTIDSTQTPNSKVKVAAMNHLRSIAQMMPTGESPANMTSSEQVSFRITKIKIDFTGVSLRPVQNSSNGIAVCSGQLRFCRDWNFYIFEEKQLS